MDPIADMLTIIRNGYLARKQSVAVPYSKIKEEIAQKLKDLGYLQAVAVEEKKIKIDLKYDSGKPVLEGIKRVSKPSLRIYTNKNEIPRVLSGLGEVILSTPGGIFSGKEAKKKNSGGELILKVW